jgi:hypothetical protein
MNHVFLEFSCKYFWTTTETAESKAVNKERLLYVFSRTVSKKHKESLTQS